MGPTGVQGTSIYDNPSLAAARTGAQSASATAANESAASISLPDQLRQALNDKFGNNNPIYAQREGALKDYLNATTQAPLNVTAKSAGGNSDVVYTPLQQANLIQQYRSPSIAHLATLNDLLNLSTGGIENIIGATSRADQGAVAGLNAKAQVAQGNYQDIFSEIKARQAEEEAQRQYELDKQRVAQSGSGGTDFSALIDALMGNKKQPYPEAMPDYNPTEGIGGKNKNIQWQSPQGYWKWNNATNSWGPILD